MPAVRMLLCSMLLAPVAAALAEGGGEAEDLAARVAQLESELSQLQRQASVRRGARLFAGACAACHGTGGRGDGAAARDLDPPPRDLTTRQYRFRTSPSGELPRPEDLERTIRRGLPGSSMPAFGELLSDEQLADLIRFVYSLRSETAPPWQPATAVELESVPPPTPASIDAGRALYLLAGCGACHGARGDGRGPSAATLTDENGRSLGSTDFRYHPLKGGRTAQDVVRTLRTGLNGAAMPSYDAALIFGADDVDRETVAAGAGDDERAALRRFLAAAPSRADLEAMEDSERAALRDRRLAALAHYVLSLDRRRGFWFRLLRQQPEREPRAARKVKQPIPDDDTGFWE